MYKLPEGWSPFICTIENIKEVWEKYNQFPILFDDYYRGDFNSFVADFFDKRTIVLKIKDYGIAMIKDIVPHRSADIHLTFWDRRFKGRDEECKQALRWLFYTMDLVRAMVTVPEIAYATRSFLKSLGFKEEGVIRKGFLYKGSYLNLCVYGILQEEVFTDGKDKDSEVNPGTDATRHNGTEVSVN